MEVTPEQSAGKVWACGFGKAGKPEFWIGSDGKTTPPTHIAFVADSRAAVRAFHEAALRAGGRDNGAPGLRPQYHSTYYGAFVLTSTATTSRRFATDPSRRGITSAMGGQLPSSAGATNRLPRREPL
jgi:hypothetical protein